jgi:outer membrane protein assembly factor BamB
MDPYRDPPELRHSILVVGLGGQLVGLDARTGEVRWRNMLPNGGIGPVHIAFRLGVLVVSPEDMMVCRIDYLTGRTLWSRPTSGQGRATILVEPDLIVIAKAGIIDGFDHAGAHLWKKGLRGHGDGPTALAFPGNVAQADPTGSL